jgi:hypothetical protein
VTKQFLVVLVSLGFCSCSKKTNDERTSGALVFFNDDNQQVSVVSKVSGSLNQGKDKIVSNFENESVSYCNNNGKRYEIYAKNVDVKVESDFSWIKQNLDLVKQGNCK